MEVGKDEGNTFRILVCTDTHAGYKERDRIRSNDSLIALEEIFIIGKKLSVDLVLHGGDLFDIAKPSKYIMYNVMNIIRKYCMGSKNISFRVLSGDNDSKNSKLNWVNGDANVSIPFFGIHGNHDDPGEEGLLSPLDILESARFINYIGKNSNVNDIEVSPVLLEKGNTRIAIYGIGNIRDERLYRSFEKGKVHFFVPEDSGEEDSCWFSIFLFHQNRKKGNFGGSLSKDSIPESFLPDFLDLVIWGHEHECVLNPVEISNKGFFVLQQGSSIATSLIQSESIDKHVTLLEIKEKTFKTTPIPLISPRTFIFKTLKLKGDNKENIESEISEEINRLILEANEIRKKKHCMKTPQCPEILEIMKNTSLNLPIIRLKVEYEDDDLIINSKRFGHQFIGKVANPHELLIFHKLSKNNQKQTFEYEDPLGLNSRLGTMLSNSNETNIIEGLVTYYSQKLNGLELLDIKEFNKAINSFVNKHDNHSIEDMLVKTTSRAKEFFQKHYKLQVQEILHLFSQSQNNESSCDIISEDTKDVNINSLITDFETENDSSNSKRVLGTEIPETRKKILRTN
ncbi:hypothetical protein FG379_002879 [Cryptosporidium bovis]|uniref:uncharacterized protein n=1 Tax=Cryptosporidium bovis TaxID=310047 RepID=UPI00351A1430|nr:hypothetical protein FG379_002879 [Cryptosporidium bovis]